jgi:hypothetical protein
MMLRASRRLAAAGIMLTFALPGAAMAHHGHNGFRHSHARGVPCRALEAGRTPARFTADQAAALKDACTTRDAAIKAANAAFRSDTAGARATYKDAVKPLVAELKAAFKARRAACHADRASQDCADARAALKSTRKADLPKIRAAWRTFVKAVRPAAHTRNKAVRAAKREFRQAVKSALA